MYRARIKPSHGKIEVGLPLKQTKKLRGRDVLPQHSEGKIAERKQLHRQSVEQQRSYARMQVSNLRRDYAMLKQAARTCDGKECRKLLLVRIGHHQGLQADTK
jgi:hypothetical protein